MPRGFDSAVESLLGPPRQNAEFQASKPAIIDLLRKLNRIGMTDDEKDRLIMGANRQ